MKFLTYLACSLFLMSIEAQEIVVRAPDGQYSVVDIEPDMSFSSALAFLQCNFNAGDFILDFMSLTPKDNVQSKEVKSIVRDYWTPLTASEKKDIAYIVNTLGMSSLLKINSSKSSIKKAGKRVDHVHPLRFLMCIFTDEETIASVHAMDGRTWVWSEFKAGITTTLDEEAAKHNLQPEHIEHFALQIGIPSGPLHTFLSSHQWDNVISHLLANVKRSAEAGRYNMSIE